MSVLARHELDQSPLADLHALASELGIEGFRGLRRDALIDAIVEAQGGEPETPTSPAAAAIPQAGVDTPAEEEPMDTPVGVAGEDDGDDTEAEDDAAEANHVRDVDEDEVDEDEVEGGEEDDDDERSSSGRDEDIRGGLLDILPNGSGFLRGDPYSHSRDDVYVSPAQIRRCELRAGDEVRGPVRPPRRSERYPSLVRVDDVNGQPAEPVEERPHFASLTAVFASRRLPAPDALGDVPLGAGSRASVAGAPGSGVTSLLRAVAKTLRERESELELTILLCGARPEEAPEWRAEFGDCVAGGGGDLSPEDLAQQASIALERAKRVVERGGDAALIVEGLDVLPESAARRLFSSARATEEGGTLTIVAGTASEALVRVATTRIVLGDDGKPGPGSGTLRADRLS